METVVVIEVEEVVVVSLEVVNVEDLGISFFLRGK